MKCYRVSIGKGEKERKETKKFMSFSRILNIKLTKIFCSLFFTRENKLSSNLLLGRAEFILDVLRDNIKLG